MINTVTGEMSHAAVAAEIRAIREELGDIIDRCNGEHPYVEAIDDRLGLVEHNQFAVFSDMGGLVERLDSLEAHQVFTKRWSLDVDNKLETVVRVLDRHEKRLDDHFARLNRVEYPEPTASPAASNVIPLKGEVSALYTIRLKMEVGEDALRILEQDADRGGFGTVEDFLHANFSRMLASRVIQAKHERGQE